MIFRNSSCYRPAKFLEREMKVVERVLINASYNSFCFQMQFGFMLERGAIDAVIMLKRMQEESHAKGLWLHMCLVDIEGAFDRVPRNVLEWIMRKKGTPEVLVRSVMSVYKGAMTRVC